MPLVDANPPAPTPEFDALTPTGLDALTRLGDDIVKEVGGSDAKDASRKNKKLPRQLAAVVALRAQGYDNQEIADKIGVSRQKITGLIQKARRDYGWSDLHEQLVHRAVPLAMESAIKHLEHEGSAMGVLKGMNAMTRTTLQGVGVFKSHSAAKVEQKSESTNVLRVEIVMPEMPMGNGAKQIEGVLSTPRRAALLGAAPSASVIEGTVVPHDLVRQGA